MTADSHFFQLSSALSVFSFLLLSFSPALSLFLDVFSFLFISLQLHVSLFCSVQHLLTYSFSKLAFSRMFLMEQQFKKNTFYTYLKLKPDFQVPLFFGMCINRTFSKKQKKKKLLLRADKHCSQ